MNAAAFAQYTSRIDRAEQVFRRGDFRDALDRYQALLQERLSGGLSGEEMLRTADVVVVERTAHLAVLFGLHDAADALLQGLAIASWRAGNVYLADYVAFKRIHLALFQGRLREAQNQLLAMSASLGDVRDMKFSPDGLVAWEHELRWPDVDAAGRKVLYANFYLAAGRQLAALGQYGEALAALERGEYHAGGNAPDLARQVATPLRLARAAAALEQGRLKQARDILATVSSGTDTAQHPGYRVEWLECAAKADLLAGEFGDALRRFEEIDALARAGAFRHAQMYAALNLGHLRILLNQTAAATELLESALREAQSQGDAAAAFRGRTLIGLAQHRRESLADGMAIAPSVLEMWDEDAGASPAAAAPLEDEDPAGFTQAASFLAFFEDRALAVQWRLARDDADAALALLDEMEQVFQATDSTLVQARMTALRGMVAYRRQDWEGAEAQLERACGAARAMQLGPELWQTLRWLGWTKARLGRSGPERQALAREADALLEGFTKSLDVAARVLFLLNKWTAEEEALAAESVKAVEARRRHASARWYRKPLTYLALLRRLDGLLWRLDRHKAYTTRRALAVSVAERGQETPPGLLRRLLGNPRRRATLVFQVLPDRTLVICAHGLRIDFGVSSLTRLQLREHVQRWHQLVLREDGGSAAPARREVGAKLATALQIPQVLSRLGRRISALRIVPDDSLHGFPFAAMAHEGRYLVERFALSVGFHTMPDPREKRAPGRCTALVAGTTSGAGEYERLDGVRDELRLVGEALAGHGWRVFRLSDEMATRDALLRLLPESALVHIACHGTFEPDRPDQSGLILIPQSTRVEALTLRDLATLGLAGTRHITLSSCWSADNFILPGRWIVSLPETLYRAGAGSILGSLWEVPDQFAVAFLARFYCHLRQNTRERALQLTQLDCLHGVIEEPALQGLPDMPFWAGFCLYGDPGSLSVRIGRGSERAP